MKLALVLVAAATWAQTSDPAAPGPRPVANTFYRFNGAQIPQIPYPVDIWSTVWYPDGLADGPYPLLLFMHGNHGICRQPDSKVDVGTTLVPPLCPSGFEQTPNHLGYDYIASRLAGYGYIVVSINANAINLRPNGNSERGRLVQEHLRYWALWNSNQGGFPFDRRFSGKVNLQSVGLMGHSRGGEGVRAAYNFNRAEGSPFGIRAVLELGPVDFGRNTGSTTPNPVFNVDDTAFSVILPACDRDVTDSQGMRIYDRARVLRETSGASPKSQVYLLGSNHNFFNSEWLPEDAQFRCIDFPIITDRAQQEQIGMVYVMGFFRTYIGGENFRHLFNGDSTQPESIRVPVVHSYTESPNDLLLIDDFSAAKSPDVNSAGGANLPVNLDLKSCSSGTCNEPPPAAWYHDLATFAGRIAWPGEGAGTPQLTMRLAEGAAPVDVSRFPLLAFRVAAEFHPRNPNTPNSQSFSVRLVDATGAQSNLVSVGEQRPIPYPTGSVFRRSVLQTQRLSLSEFRNVDRGRITAIQFVFDRTRQGAIFLSDVHFSPR